MELFPLEKDRLSAKRTECYLLLLSQQKLTFVVGWIIENSFEIQITKLVS